MCGPSTLTRRELEAANGSVKRVLAEATNVVGSDMTPCRGQYNEYTAEVRAQIGKYAAENGASKAARRFSRATNISYSPKLIFANIQFKPFWANSPNIMPAKISRYTVPYLPQTQVSRTYT